MVEHFLEVLSVLLVVVDPLGIVPVFLGLTQGYDAERRHKVALQACFIGLVVLVAFTFLGDWMLDTLHISEPAFRIAGAILLLLTAIDMVVAHHLGFSAPPSSSKLEGEASHNVAVFPLAIPLIAGPGGMVSVIMLMRRIEGNLAFELNIILAIFVTLLATYLVLRFAGQVSSFIGVSGANVLTRVFGIILAALAIQFIINAINDLMLVPFFKV